MINTKQLAQMRETVALLFPDTCTFLTPTTTVDNQGGIVQTWGTVTGCGTVSCRLDALGGGNKKAGEAMQDFKTFILSVPYDKEILETYRIVHNGYTYKVTESNLDTSWKVVNRAKVERV